MLGPKAWSEDGIRQAAADWVARVHDPGAAVDRGAFERWRGADPRHAAAYARAELAWKEAAMLAATRVGRGRQLPTRAARSREVIPRAALVAAALALMMVGTTIAVLRTGASGDQPAPAQLASRVGDIRRVVLADGSRVTLDTDTVVRVAFDRTTRNLILVRGRARFDVAHEAARPFIVMAGNASVTAHGTVFDVSLVDGRLSVALLRGSIDVRRGMGTAVAPAASTRLAPGQHLAFGAAAVSPIPPPVPGRIPDWTNGMLTFDGTRLGDAIAAANRYSTGKIAVAEPALADRRVTGAYRAGDAEGLANSLAASLGLRAVRTPRGDILIVTPPSASRK